MEIQQNHSLTHMQRPLLNSPVLNNGCGGNSHRNIFNARGSSREESTSGLLWWLRAVRSNNVKYLLTSELYAKRKKMPRTDFLSSSESERNARDASAAAVLWNRSSLSVFCWGEEMKYLTGIWPLMHMRSTQEHQCRSKSLFDLLNVCVYNMTVSSCEQTILQSIFFYRRVKGMNNECCMRQKTRESRPAGCCCPPF